MRRNRGALQIVAQYVAAIIGPVHRGMIDYFRFPNAVIHGQAHLMANINAENSSYPEFYLPSGGYY